MLTVILKLSALRPDWISCDLLPYMTRNFLHETIPPKWNLHLNFLLSFLFAIVLVFIEDLINFKALAKPAESQVDASLGLLATLFGQGLRALALTYDDLRSLWSRSNLHASRRQFYTVWPLNPSQRKLSNVH